MEERIEQLEKEVADLKEKVAAVTTTDIAEQLKKEIVTTFTHLNQSLS